MSHLKRLENKIISKDHLSARVKELRSEGKSIVFTNGVFDIVHKGHITLLSKAADLGDALILGLNSDKSVRTLGKGPDRPINKEEDRAFVIAGLELVDNVVIFNDSTPIELISIVEPDVLVKGGDYNSEQEDPLAKDYIVGSDLQRKSGRETTVINLVDGYSSSSVIEKLGDGKS